MMNDTDRNDDDATRRGGSFYDKDPLLDQYLKHRHRAVSSPNLVMEEPAFLRHVGDLKAKRVLDLGCGDGNFGRHCLAAGCDSYLGVDGSIGMIERAKRALENDQVRFEVADLEDFAGSEGAFDLVASRLALHYVADLEPVLTNARDALAPDGRLVVTVLHPVLTAGSNPPDGPRESQVVDNYFSPGPRERRWFGEPVIWQHRTIGDYLTVLSAAGFQLETLDECAPKQQRFDGNNSEYERRLRVPLFLLLSARVSSR